MDVSEIIDDLEDHGFEDTSEARKLAALNDTLWDVTGREPWPFLEKSVALSFNGSSSTPTNLPSDLDGRSVPLLLRGQLAQGVADPGRDPDGHDEVHPLAR